MKRHVASANWHHRCFFGRSDPRHFDTPPNHLSCRLFGNAKGSAMMHIKSEVKDEIRIIIIDIQRLVDGPGIEQCSREITELLDKTEERYVLLHFGRIAFMSSAALGMLIRLNKKCKEYKISLKLCNISPDILQAFKITGLDKVFSIYGDASDAMAAFKKGGQMFFRGRKETSHELT
jgi:anti-sigma B factor antagonist